MSSGKPAIAVKPRSIELDLKSAPAIPSVRPSVAELAKKLDEELKTIDAGKKIVTSCRSVDVPPHATTTPGLHRIWGRSNSHTMDNSRQGRKDTVNADNGIELTHGSLHNGRKWKVTPQNPTLDTSGPVVGVTGKDVDRKVARQSNEMRVNNSQNLGVDRMDNHMEVSTRVEVYLYGPIAILMEQIMNSVEMPVIRFNSFLETKLTSIFSSCNGDIEKARIRCISEWNDTVNELLKSTGYSLSDFNRNIASLILCEANLDMRAARECLRNDLVKMAITRHVSSMEQSGWMVDYEISRMNPSVWDDIVKDVKHFCFDCKIEQKCQICWEMFSSDKIFGLCACQCVVCNACMQSYFVVMIHDGYVANFVCPVCHLPDVEDATLHFQLLEPKLKTLLSDKNFRAYQRRMTEWNLMKNPNFRWCINITCISGFVVEENGYSRVTCPDCRLEMCHKCRKPWEEQHVGLTCEQFKAWKESNDPEFQEAALKQQLQENGIDCPRCSRRYLLSKGGCIHFTCTFCQYEFCSSCSRPFVRACKKLNHCQQSGGLHCHHPRNCLYYLRDRSVVELQRLLKHNDVSYEMSHQTDITTCQVLEEQDTDTGFSRENMCNAKSFLPGHAGYCEKHYKEYLVGIIQRNRIDPAAVMSQSELIRELQNSGITKIPVQLKTETENHYLCRLRDLVMANAVLPIQDRH